MIIFDLDGTLADCEHRRHFVVAPEDTCHECYNIIIQKPLIHLQCCKCERWPTKWKPNWKAFFATCDKDKPIVFTIGVLKMLLHCDAPIEIWSGRCESVRQQTIDWLEINVDPTKDWGSRLKMRPIGDSTPDDQLKESWIDEAKGLGKVIDFVFDDRPKVVRMWRRRGIFVFNCAQHDEEF